MDGWMDGWMDGVYMMKDGWIDGQMHDDTHFFEDLQVL